jgi:VWFA-related protein
MTSLLLLLVGMLVLPLAAQQPPPRFSTRTDLVRVDVLVTDGRRVITGLGPQDFEIRDNGVVQRIDRVLRRDEPIDAWLLLDESSSVRLELGALIEAAKAFGASLDARDRSGLITFRHALTVRTALTPDRSPLFPQLTLTHAEGYTSMRDAVFLALALREESMQRSLILMFTDGQDTKSWLTDAQIIHAVDQSDAVIYAVTAANANDWNSGDDGLDVSWRPRRGLLKELAEKSGGKLLTTDSSRHLSDVFTTIVMEMKARYLLTYYPSDVTRAGWHRLEVRVKRPSVRVRARHGYFATESPRLPQ